MSCNDDEDHMVMCFYAGLVCQEFLCEGQAFVAPAEGLLGRRHLSREVLIGRIDL